MLDRERKLALFFFLGVPFTFCLGFFCGAKFATGGKKFFKTYNAIRKGLPCQDVQDPIQITQYNVSNISNVSNIATMSVLPKVQTVFYSAPWNFSKFSVSDTDLENEQPVFCAKSMKCKSRCAGSHEVKSFLKARSEFSLQSHMAPNITIFIDKAVKTFHQEQPWQKQLALDRCPVKSCYVVPDRESANVVLCNLFAPTPRLPNVTYAVLNLEAHSYQSLPADANNVMLVSFHSESELVINYGYTITHRMAVCLGPRIEGQKCENMEDPSTPFYKWCTNNFQGDVLTCLFNVMPHIARMNGVNKSSEKALAPAWISVNCERHNSYLPRLMMRIPIDSMAACYTTRNEVGHPGLQLIDHDGLWWGAGNVFSKSMSSFRSYANAARKVAVASHYWFFVSIENTIMDDYITEKFYEGFLADTLMVYFGAPNARDYAPANHSYIHALDFAGPNQLADFLLALLEDRERYESYFWWKREVPAAISPRFREQMRLGLEHTNEDSMLCRLCTKLYQPNVLNSQPNA